MTANRLSEMYSPESLIQDLIEDLQVWEVPAYRAIRVHPDTLDQLIAHRLVTLDALGRYLYVGYPLLVDPTCDPIGVDPATVFTKLVEAQTGAAGTEFDGDAANEDKPASSGSRLAGDVYDTGFAGLAPAPVSRTLVIAQVARGLENISAAFATVARMIEESEEAFEAGL